VNQLLIALAGPDVRNSEQYFDFFQGRQFRQSLLVKSENASEIRRTVDHRRIAHLHFSSNLRLVPDQSNGEALVLSDPSGPTITTNDPIVAKALDHLGASFPETRSLRQLLDFLEVNGEAKRQAVADRVMASVLRVITAGLGSVSAVPVKIGRAADAKPKVWLVARHDNRTDQPWTTNLRHMPVRLDPVGNALVPMVDGHNDRSSMASYLGTLINEAKLGLNTLDGFTGISDTSDDSVTKLAARVDLVLRQLEQLALLEPTQ
jgi:methyltransferase-like protein